MEKIQIDEARQRLLDFVNTDKTQQEIEDGIYTLVHEMFMNRVAEVEKENTIVDVDGIPCGEDDEVAWYDGTREDDIRERFFDLVYTKIYNWLAKF